MYGIRKKVRMPARIPRRGPDNHINRSQREFRVEMLIDVLEPLLARDTGLDGLDIGNIMCLCKSANTAVDWKCISASYIPRPGPVISISADTGKAPCERCGKLTNLRLFGTAGEPSRRCLKCRNVIPCGAARRKYKVDKADLSCLPKFKIQYGHHGVSTRDVVGVALLKHGGPTRLRQAMLPRRERCKASQQRSARLQKLELNAYEISVLTPLGLEQFLRNGRGGITEVKRLRYSLYKFGEMEGNLPEYLKMIVRQDTQWRDQFVRWHQTPLFLIHSLHREYNKETSRKKSHYLA